MSKKQTDYMKYLRWLINNKAVQSFVKARVSTKIWTGLVAVVMALGLTSTPVVEYVEDVTTEGVKATIMENGGGAIRSLYLPDEAEIETGLVEQEEEAEAVSSDNYEYELPNDAPTWNDVKGNGIYNRTRDQEHGTCVFESYDIIAIEALLHLGLDPVTNGEDPFIDINHGYLDKRYQPGVDSGSVPRWVFDQFEDDGLPIRTTYQDVDSDNWTFEEMKAQADEDAYNYKVKAPFTLIASGNGPDTLMRDLDRFKSEGREVMFRISKRNHSNVAWFHETTPYIKSQVAKKTGGGHSMAGAGTYGVFEYKGEPTIYIHESAGSVRYHLARKSVLEMVMTSWEIYEPNGDIETTISNTVAPQNDPLATETIRIGDRGESTTALQNYLLGLNISIPAGATGYFGGQTKRALNEWQDTIFGNVYDGSVWGPKSREMYNILNTQ